jgi:hypothetical protein|tara:strand:- start:364 stop:519 length:156 start_codon:yes stop_codon:yes gene_type:complete
MTIDKEIQNLTKDELMQLFELLSFKSPAFEKNLYDALTLIRANRRAQGGRG